MRKLFRPGRGQRAGILNSQRNIKKMEMDNIQSDEMKEKDCYDILGIKTKMKPIKLQLNKDAYLFMERLNKYIRKNTGLTEAEMKDEDSYYIISLSVLGFLADEKNLAELFHLMLEGDTEWSKVIDGNKDRINDLKNTGVLVLNDFFLRTLKLTGMSKN
jgi:hypothetical protein